MIAGIRERIKEKARAEIKGKRLLLGVYRCLGAGGANFGCTMPG